MSLILTCTFFFFYFTLSFPKANHAHTRGSKMKNRNLKLVKTEDRKANKAKLVDKRKE